MSKKMKKIKGIVENVYCKSFDEILQISAVLKCLECASYYYEDSLTNADVNLIVNLIQQKIQIVRKSLDDLSLF